MAAAVPAPYALADALLLAQCQQQAIQGSGPGGQHRNRTASAVRLVHRGSGIDARCEEHREHRRNLLAALARLRLRLALALRGVSEPAWLALPGPIPHQPRSPRYPLVVACCLDALEECQGSLPQAARMLAMGSSQLARILTADKEVRSAANALRARHGCGPVHD